MGDVAARTSEWARNDHASVRLVTAADAVGGAETLRAGLHFRLRSGWKIYWRSPGDAGYPPKLDWQGSENLRAAEIDWPVPKRFSILGLFSLGYSDEVVLPLKLTPKTPGAAVKLRAGLDYLICEIVCVPYRTTLSLDIPAGPATPAEAASLIARFQAKVPIRVSGGHGIGLGVSRAEVAGSGDNMAVLVTTRAEPAFGRASDVIVEGTPSLRVGVATAQFVKGGGQALWRVPVAGIGRAALVGAALTVTLVDGDRALESGIVAKAGPARVAAPASLFGILILALLGGLILNFMPCVLPVLSIKLLSLVEAGGADRRDIRRGFLAAAAGVIVSFAGLAGVAILLKSLGMAAGWGIQFQSPLFLAAMTVLLTLFACNMWGWFDISLPARFSRAGEGARIAEPGGGGLSGHFLTGVLVAVLATPCSAPFVGTAVGFALSRGIGEILSIFIALGLGLAAPYFIVAATPAIARHLPRPGRWMVVLRRVLGFALGATAVWLISVLWAEGGADAAYGVGALMVLLGLTLWLMTRPAAAGLRRAIPLTAPIAVLVLTGLTLAAPSLLSRPASAPVAAGEWRHFDRQALAELVAGGQVVLVDVTAEWCLTCKVNKALVLDRGAVAENLRRGAMLGMRADWTRPDAGIAAYLASFGRFGIPFNAVYGPAAPGGIALPELLTEKAVLAAVARARG